MVFVLWSSLSYTLIKYRCPIKKNDWITPTYIIARNPNGQGTMVSYYPQNTPQHNLELTHNICTMWPYCGHYQLHMHLYIVDQPWGCFIWLAITKIVKSGFKIGGEMQKIHEIQSEDKYSFLMIIQNLSNCIHYETRNG